MTQRPGAACRGRPELDSPARHQCYGAWSAPQPFRRSRVFLGARACRFRELSFLISVGRNRQVAGRNHSAGDEESVCSGRGTIAVDEHFVGANGVIEVDRRASEQAWRSGPRASGAESTWADIVAPDRFSAGLLVDLVGSSCPVELVGTGTGWVVRLQQRAGFAWEADLLALVRSWLVACPLPCATIVCGGRRYLLRLALAPRPRPTVYSGGDLHFERAMFSASRSGDR